MSDKYKNDQLVLEKISILTGGFKPEAYFYAESGFKFGILDFLLGPLIGSIIDLLTGKMYLVTVANGYIYLIKTNSKSSKFKDDFIKFHRNDVVTAKCSKRFKGHNFTIELRDGKSYEFLASEAYIHLEDRIGNISRFEGYLGITHD